MKSPTRGNRCWELVCGLEDSGRGCLLFILKGAHTDPALARLGLI